MGVLGCDSGVGVTHLALSLCGYCASKRRKKTAFLEMHTRSEISQLAPESQCFPAVHTRSNVSGSADFFRMQGVDYYPHVSAARIPTLLNQGYDYLILDLGYLNEADIAEFLLCDRKLVLGSLAPWKIWKYEAFFLQLQSSVNLGEGFCYLVQTGSRRNLHRFSGSHRVAMANVPLIQNPFRIGKELFSFFETLLAEV